jgi:uncharacterized protein with FMN-binding domain
MAAPIAWICSVRTLTTALNVSFTCCWGSLWELPSVENPTTTLKEAATRSPHACTRPERRDGHGNASRATLNTDASIKAVVRSNRLGGPGRVIEVVGERSQDRFMRLEDVITPAALAAMVGDYARLAGFTGSGR